jgi:hypothetical protein
MKPVAIAALASAWLLLTAGSCATTSQPAIRTVTVDRPVPVSCAPTDYVSPAASPVTRETLRAAPDAAARYQLLAEFWTTETPVLALQADVIAACRDVGPAAR